MKFFIKKSAFTLTELVVSFIIMVFIIGAIMTFLSSSSETLVNSNKKVNISQKVLNTKNSIDKLIDKGYSEFQIITSNSSSYNCVLFFNPDLDKAFVLGVVDLDTKKLKTQKTFGENYLGYRLISKSEFDEIKTDITKIYDKTFQKDKISNIGVIKDFKLEKYDGDFLSSPILDLEFSVITNKKDFMNGKSFSEINSNTKDFTYKYNFIF